MSAKNLRVGIVGCGSIGRIHAAALSEFAGVQIAACVGGRNAIALADDLESQSRRRPITSPSLADALAGAALDLVVISTPSGLHVEEALECLAAGTHLVIEKPLGIDLAQVRQFQRVADAAAENGSVISVIAQHRFDASSQVVAAAVQAGRFGRLTSAIASVAWWRSQQYYDARGGWRGTWAMDGGGALMNQGAHILDLLLWFLGTPVEVFAQTRRLAHAGIEVEDTAAVTLSFESGAVAVLNTTTAAFPGLTTRVQLMGSEGSAIIDGDELTYFHADGRHEDVGMMGLGGGGNQAERADDGRDPDAGVPDATTTPVGHIRQYADILGALRAGTRPLVQVSDAVLALATARAAYVSATLHQAVRYDDVLAGSYDDVLVQIGT